MKKKVSKMLLALLLVLGLAGVSNATSCPVDMCNGESVKVLVSDIRTFISTLRTQKRDARAEIKELRAQTPKPKALIKEKKELITNANASITVAKAEIKALNEGWCPPPNMTPPGNNPVPEPATMLLLGAGIAGIAGVRLRKKNK